MKLTLVMGAMALTLCELAIQLQQTRQKAPATTKLFYNFTNKSNLSF